MKQHISLAFSFLILLLFTACQAVNTQSANNSDKNQPLIGEWKETWTSAQSGGSSLFSKGKSKENKTLVDYNDIYRLRLDRDHDLVVYCETHQHYKFRDLEFDGKHLNFTLINDMDPNDIYMINYKMVLNGKKNMLSGTAENNKNQKAVVQWKKIQ